jgi:hypothetical protein
VAEILETFYGKLLVVEGLPSKLTRLKKCWATQLQIARAIGGPPRKYYGIQKQENFLPNSPEPGMKSR